MLLNKKNPHGGDIYGKNISLDFSANINPFGMPEGVKAALEAAVKTAEIYPDPYCRVLRESIANYEGVKSENILCGNGAEELIFAFAHSLNKEKPALIIEPTFSEYAAALRAAGADYQSYILSKKNAYHLTQDILKLDFSDYSALFLCSPNNPTGFLAEPAILEAIAATGIRLLLDVSFLDFTQNPHVYDIAQLLQKYPNVCVLRSMTKTYAIAGVRLGYALCSDSAFLEGMAQKTPCWNVSAFAQQAGVAALGEQGRLRESILEIADIKEALVCRLNKLGITVFKGEANYLLLYSDKPLYQALLARGILVRDCSDFEGLKSGFIRISVRKQEENERLLAALKEILS